MTELELIAALDAGLLDAGRAAHAAALPGARAVLDALAATRAELAVAPPPALPPEVAAGWAAALAAEQVARNPSPRAEIRIPDRLASRVGPEPATPPMAPDRWAGPGRVRRAAAAARRRAVRRSSAARPRRPAAGGSTPGRRAPAPPRRASRRAVVVAALVALLATGLVLRPAPGPVPVPVDRIGLAALGAAAVGVLDVGELADPARRAACLRAAGVGEPAPVLGGRRVVLDGAPGILLVLATGQRGRFRILVVAPSCGPGDAGILADTMIGM